MMIINNDNKKNMINQSKQDIMRNLIETRETINGGADNQDIISEYDDYFDQIKNEKNQQIQILKSILEHLEKLNYNTKNLQSKSNVIVNDINKIKSTLSNFHNELANI